MNFKPLRNLLIASGLALCPGALWAAPANVLSLDHSLRDSTVVYPFSYETDTRAMLDNWYLKNYTVLDTKADSRSDVEVTDEVLIERLGALPNVIEMPLNSVVRNHIMMYANRRKQLVENMLALGLYYMPIFEDALDRHGLPLELKYLAVIESALNPNAVSPAGATGLWQFMMPTAKGLGLEISSLIDERRDPYISSDAAARYLKQLYQTFGDWSLAIAAYNCGPGNINKALRRAGDGKHDFWDIYPFLPSETRGYVPGFIAANYIMNHYASHNISPALARRPISTDTIHVTRRVHFQQIADVLDIPMDEIRVLNPQYRTDVIPGDIKPYALVLPSLQAYAYAASEDSILNHNAELYARRQVVEPASGNPTGSDSKGEYVDETVTQYHKVKRGETLAAIARRYGVTVSDLRKWNKVGKSVKAGKRLKILTRHRKYLPKAAPAPVQADSVAQSISNPADSVSMDSLAAIPAVLPDSIPVEEHPETPAVKNSGATGKVSNAFNNSKKNTSNKATNKANTGTKKNTTRSHTVRSGENLFKIAKRYGVKVDALKRANGLRSDAIKAGQKLVIP